MPSAGGAKGLCPLDSRPSAGGARGRCPLHPCDFFVKKSSKNFITPAGGTEEANLPRNFNFFLPFPLYRARFYGYTKIGNL